MSRFDYGQSRQLVCADYSFESLIMAAYRRADSQNAALLRADWPEIVEELQARYNAPGGFLDGEHAPPSA
jgi:hypothetical protein